LESIVRCRLGVTGRRVAIAWIAAGACLAVAGCSPGADYPSLFPAVHDTSPPRADAPLDPVQVQQATEDLIKERDHLTAETQQGTQQGSASQKSASPAATSTSAKRPKNQAGVKSQTGTEANAGSGGLATAAGTETAGAESK
jgi:hypothetical protein